MLSDDLSLNLSFLSLFLLFMNAQQVTSGELRLKRTSKRSCILIFCPKPTMVPPTLPVSSTSSPQTTLPPTIFPPTSRPQPTILPPTSPPIFPPTSPPIFPPTSPPPTLPPTTPITTALPPTIPTKPTKPGEVSCPIPLKKMGCYKDNQSPPRPLPKYILTDRDNTLPIYSGIDVDWGDWINYLPDLVCRCAKQATLKGYQFFGIQFYGECWSGPSNNETVFKKDGQSNNCVDAEWKNPCDDESKMACAGKELNNYVYAIQ